MIHAVALDDRSVGVKRRKAAATTRENATARGIASIE